MSILYQRYLALKKKGERFWIYKLVDEFGWEEAGKAEEYDWAKTIWEDKKAKELEDWHKQHIVQEEKRFIDEFLDNEKNARWARIKRILFLAHNKPKSTELKMLLENKIARRVTDEMIEKAKEYPIPMLLGEPVMGKYRCISHKKDKTPSLHYYKATNSVFCFSCGYYGDSIAVAQKIYNLSFQEAVKKLN